MRDRLLARTYVRALRSPHGTNTQRFIRGLMTKFGHEWTAAHGKKGKLPKKAKAVLEEEYLG